MVEGETDNDDICQSLHTIILLCAMLLSLAVCCQAGAEQDRGKHPPDRQGDGGHRLLTFGYVIFLPFFTFKRDPETLYAQGILHRDKKYFLFSRYIYVYLLGNLFLTVKKFVFFGAANFS
jgi:hypothetical protein